METIRLLGICGSPRKKGNSHYLLERTLAAATEVNPEHVQSELYSLARKKIAPCIACDRCEKVGDCIQEDDFQQLRDKWVAADAIIYSVPVYHMGIPAQLKCFFDRLGNSLFSRYGSSIAKSMKAIGAVVQGSHLFAGQEHVMTALINHAVIMGCLPVAGDLWQSYLGAAGWTRNKMDNHAIQRFHDSEEEDARITVTAAESLGRRVVQVALVLKTGGRACRELLATDEGYQGFLGRLDAGAATKQEEGSWID